MKKDKHLMTKFQYPRAVLYLARDSSYFLLFCNSIASFVKPIAYYIFIYLQDTILSHNCSQKKQGNLTNIKSIHIYMFIYIFIKKNLLNIGFFFCHLYIDFFLLFDDQKYP